MKWKKGLRVIEGSFNSKSSKSVPGLKELHLTHNRFGPFFLKAFLNVIRDDNYLRVLDLQNNGITANILQENSNYDLFKSL